jgi:hypothetical protein
MIIAITPSLNAARRSLPMTLSPACSNSAHYQGQQLNLAMGAESSRRFEIAMSALHPKADIPERDCDVR